VWHNLTLDFFDVCSTDSDRLGDEVGVPAKGEGRRSVRGV
jgi:hypothetical protein